MKKALIVYGGWEGHQPDLVAEIFRKGLAEMRFDVDVSNTLDAFTDEEKLMALDLIIPIWTMGQITPELLTSQCRQQRRWPGGMPRHGCRGATRCPADQPTGGRPWSARRYMIWPMW